MINLTTPWNKKLKRASPACGGASKEAAQMLMSTERGGEYKRRMDSELSYVDTRLTEWAKWAKQRLIAGYPVQSVYTKDRVGGAGPPPAEMPPHVWEVERAILKLKDIERQVVVTYYTQWAPRECMARSRHMSVHRFDKLLRQARWRVRDMLDGIS